MFVFSVFAIVLTGRYATAGDAAPPSGASPSTSLAALPADLLVEQVRQQTEASLGEYVRSQRSSFAMVVLVEGGRTRLEQAYGLEDPDSKLPFSIDTTLVDLESIKKLFTSVALAKLIDQGTIRSLDDPVNLYLKDFKLPASSGREITIQQLATQSAGFDGTEFGAGPLNSDAPRFFSERFPGYIAGNGPFSSYSEYGIVLLDHLLSQISGKSFGRLIADQVFLPLGMKHSYIEAPPEPLPHRVLPFQPKAPELRVPGGELPPVDSALGNGQAVATGRDMASFMLALLGHDVSASPAITPSMEQLMFQIRQSNGDWGSAHGLVFDALRTGYTTLYNHGAKGMGMSCLLTLDQVRDAGLFYCYGHVRSRFDLDPQRYPPDFDRVKELMLKPFTDCPPEAATKCLVLPKATAWNPAWNSYVGQYVAYSRQHRGPSKLRSIIHPDLIRVEATATSMRIGAADGYVEFAPGAFGSPNSLETFSFIRNPLNGEMVLSGSARPTAYEHPDWNENPRFVPKVLALLSLIVLSGGLITLFPQYRLPLVARLAVTLEAGIVAAGIFVLFGLHAYGQPYFDGISWPLKTLVGLAFMGVPVSILLAALLPRVRRSRATGWFAKLHYGLICLGSMLLALSLVIVELISFERVI